MTTFSSSLIFLNFLFLPSWATSPPDYSYATDPAILLDIIDLHASRESHNYGDHVLPASPGFIELECTLRLDSLPSSIPDRAMKNASVVWVMPNGKIIEEGRAYESRVRRYQEDTISLAITDFKAEDAGLYECRMLLDEQPSEFYRAVNIPALDGSPILECKVRCKRNQEKKCQILENYNINCAALGFPKPDIFCIFQECETEETCPPPEVFPESIYGFGHSSRVYRLAHKLVVDELALKSGRYFCEASSNEKKSNVSMFIGVSAVAETSGLDGPRIVPPPAPSLIWPPSQPGLVGITGLYGLPNPLEPVPPSLTPEAAAKQLFLGTISTKYPKIGEKLIITCWTNENSVSELQWTFWNASSPNKMEIISEGSHPDFQLTNEHDVSGGHLSQIHISHLELEHGGFYVCGLIKSGIKLSQDFVVETYRWAPDANMNQDLKVTRAIGESITMRCSVITTEKDPGYRWWKDGEVLQASEDGRVQLSSDKQTLMIHTLELSDSGVYTCKSYPLFSLGVPDLEGKTALTVTEDDDPANHVENLNKAISSLSSIQQVLTEMADDFTVN